MAGRRASQAGGTSAGTALRLALAAAVLLGALNLRLAHDLDANRRTLAELERRVAETRSSVALELETLRTREGPRLIFCRSAGPSAPAECVALEDLPPCGRFEPPSSDPRT